MQRPETLQGLRIIFGIVPFIGIVFNIIVLYFYNLDDKTLDTIENDLEKRKKQSLITEPV
ncbi:MAG: hypothetical protein HC906_06230 [Bacteroidales bacterium]|nr:hypothetical protein [Bacteroidales bacterium]